MQAANKLIDYMTFPNENKKISGYNIARLNAFLKDFDFSIINDHYSFIYENIEILISKTGIVLISLISKADVSDNVSILTNIASKINSNIKIDSYATEINIYDQDNPVRNLYN